MTFRAILFGATGMVGEGVLLEALAHDNVESILAIGRRPCGITHAKLREVIHGDFFDYSPILENLGGYQACFFCLGVSSVGMGEREYTRITYDLTMEAATVVSGLNPGMTFCYVSGAGTDSTERGRLMWARVKGKTENDLLKLPFKAVYAFRPGLMRPTTGQKRVKPVLQTLGALLYPVLKTLRPSGVCTVKELGRAMIGAADTGYPKNILETRDICHLARTGAETTP